MSVPLPSSFAGKRPGDRVTFLRFAGLGRRGPEFKPAAGKVVMAFASHLVLNMGGRYGTPAVVDAKNFIR